MGKLFPAFLLKKRDRLSCFLLSCLPAGRCSCTQDKFVKVLAPGHAHLHAIKILHRDSFLAKVPGPDSYRDCPVLASGNAH
jgi:hypothetical protein